ncbi:MAG: hypothetical protein LC627_03975 [Verrucomicrobiaceae bacterium]|nr:hypothetical protein [Verrucomicrobiaceae bacterium]
MIGPPLRKLSTKKFLSNALFSGAGLAAAGEPLGEGDAPVAVVMVVVAGDMAVVAGVVPGIGEIPGAVAAGDMAAGLVPVMPGDMAGTAGVVAGAIGAVAAGLVAVVGGAPGGLLTGDGA